MILDAFEERIKGLLAERKMRVEQRARTEESTLTLDATIAWIDSKLAQVRGEQAHAESSGK